jgi:hypothetical protein
MNLQLENKLAIRTGSTVDIGFTIGAVFIVTGTVIIATV